MKTMTTKVIVLVLVLLAGCQEGFKIIVDDFGDRAPNFRLESLAMVSPEGVEITNFAIIEFAADGKIKDLMWRIESNDKSLHRVRDIKYGVVPTGFRETSAPKTLNAGIRYEAASRMPGKVGYVEFVLR